ncbi:hypothetical protein MLD38_018963 [Melastoma candidum]|nr:hypothetical protein MLD38_018963 [Melastoma candidum]
MEVDKSAPKKCTKRLGSKSESPESPNMESHTLSSSKANPQGTARSSPAKNTEANTLVEPEPAHLQAGCSLVEEGEAVGRGRLFQLHCIWSGKDPIFSGHTFEEVETNWGMMSVIWDADRISLP